MQNDMLKSIVFKYKDVLRAPGDELLRMLGYDGLYSLSEAYGGSSLYVPTIKRLFQDCMEQAIVEEFNGFNSKALAVKFGVCERTIHNIMERRSHAKTLNA